MRAEVSRVRKTGPFRVGLSLGGHYALWQEATDAVREEFAPPNRQPARRRLATLPRMTDLPRLRTESPAGLGSATRCGSRLARAGALAEERKLVTALFCDLVGFTATSESADPEDVDRMLTAYFAMARSQIEAHGGVVEKFIGDAVVGVFGVPAPTRTTPSAQYGRPSGSREAGGPPWPRRCAPRLRVGINTGEALVRLGVSPGQGERFLAGDAINTASRIQSVAPEMGVAVGLPTFEATTAASSTRSSRRPASRARLSRSGSSTPIAPRARLGIDLTRAHATPFVGREARPPLLDQASSTRPSPTSSASSPRSSASPGSARAGSSRELLAHADAHAELVTWRQGRCLPYGEGISFWALGELVKAHAGILDSDAPDVAIAKLGRVLPDDDHAWIAERLLPLRRDRVSEPQPSARSSSPPGAGSSSCSRANARPSSSFEDLHWADDPMLAFLESIDRAGPQVPLLIVGTSRPELYRRRPGPGAPRIDLGPLSADAAGALADQLLEAAVIGPELRPTRSSIAQRATRCSPRSSFDCSGPRHPRGDRGILAPRGTSLPLPESIHALLAARLDALPAAWKATARGRRGRREGVLGGRRRGDGGARPGDVYDAARSVSRKEFIRPVQAASIAGEASTPSGMS